MAPVICYPNESLPTPDLDLYRRARTQARPLATVTVPPREGAAFRVPAGGFFRITCVEGPQVGDMNLWNAHDPGERFFSGKTRQLHATHVSIGDRLWSTLPWLRPMATITEDTLAWYGFDADGAGVHDVIGTRCDPYTNRLLRAQDYDHCCHSNLIRALVRDRGWTIAQAQALVHDVLNVFMCTGFTADTHQYFMKASPVRPGDHLELFAEMDLLCALSTCPGGDCGSSHSDDSTPCFPLRVEIHEPVPDALRGWSAAQANAYPRTHGR
ncbi:MAG: DUF1989 domain-containing protein [Gammaproteobacteria bacterium]|nr:DUF1989 domain-containing protein [Gammaproteobacteria bacterium]